MTVAWHWTWAAVAFLSELAALAALAVGGWSLPVPTAGRVLAAALLPLAAAVLWGVFAAPSAPVQAVALAVATKVLIYGGAGLALVAAGHPRLAAALAVAAVLGTVLSGPPSSLLTPPAAG